MRQQKVDIRVHDRVALDEIELYTEVLTAVATAEQPLTTTEIDKVLGLRDTPWSDFAGFYSDEFAPLVRFVIKHGADLHEAADAAQSAMVNLYPRWSQVRKPRAYIRKAALREYIGSAPRREYPADVLPDRGVLPADSGIELAVEERAVLAALHALPFKQRNVMAWRYDGFGIPEIAEELGMSQDAVRQNLHRARENLKRTFSRTKGEANDG